MMSVLIDILTATGLITALVMVVAFVAGRLIEQIVSSPHEGEGE